MNERGHDRLFYAILQHQTPAKTTSTVPASTSSKEKLLDYVRDNIIGNDKVFSGPFGLRKVTYLDYVASGRSLKFIEDYIEREVLPEYANTHTTTSVTSLQTTLYRHESRDIIRNACNASEHDSIIFVGSGCTGAIHKLLCALNLTQSPIVFVGPYEHHSLFLPWLEIGSEVIRIKETKDGLVDVLHLKQMLQKCEERGKQLIGCFSAASNITGILANINEITITLHKHGALAFWDYATAAPYLQIDMNPVINDEDQAYVYKDAVFISSHKFIGGVSTPGILMAKKSLFRNSRPEVCGGGTVFFVRRDGHRYLQEPELKEEGGTPAIVESIRAGLIFQLKEAITSQYIMEREHYLLHHALQAWNKCPNLVILGNTSVSRLPVFSFLIYHPGTGRFLHHNFVSAILNDVFGIQSRGGCACAGPYAMDLLGLSEDKAKAIENLLIEDRRLDRTHLRRYREYSHREIIRPGFTRINLPCFLTEEELQFVIQAVNMVAEHGWKLLPQYIFNPETGEWKQKNFQNFKDRKWLGHINYQNGCMEYKVPPPVVKGPLPKRFQECLLMAQDIFTATSKTKLTLPDQRLLFDEDTKPYRWFLLPSEAQVYLHGNNEKPIPLLDLPFCPNILKQRLGITVEADCINPASVLFNFFHLESNHEKTTVLPFSDGMTEYLNKGFQTANFYSKDVDDNIPNFGSLTLSKDVNLLEIAGFDIEKELPSKVAINNKDIRNDIVIMEDTHTTTHVKLESLEYAATSINMQTKTMIDSNKIVHEANNIELLSDTVPGNEEYVCPLLRKPDNCPVTDENMITKTKWFPPPKDIFKPTVTALEEYNMIRDGDHLLVCLSGGKDSLSLLHTIKQYQFYCKAKGIHFEFGAITVDPQTPAYDPSPLIDYLASLHVAYFFESQCILETASNLPYECASICSFCSRMKRGRIYACARREGYNVLALGQHLDDLAESFMMSFFHNGSIRTMKACYTVQEGDLRVIRPFVYVREKQLRKFAEKCKLPVIAENCPACFEAPKERHRNKQLLASQELLFPQLYNSMMAAMKPIMAINKTDSNINTLLHQQLS